MNKKGVGNLAIIIVIGLGILLMFGSVIWFGVTTQTTIQQGQEKQTATQIQTTALKGSATVDYQTYDLESTTATTPVAVPLYVYNKNTKTYPNDGSATNGGSGANVKSVTANVDDVLQFWAFNGTYYADTKTNGEGINPLEYKVPTENPTVNAYVHRIMSWSPKITIYKDSDSCIPGNCKFNITIDSATTNIEITKIRIENNGTASLFKLKTILVDINDTSGASGLNISSMDLKGSASIKGIDSPPATSVVATEATSDEQTIYRTQGTPPTSRINDFLWDIDTDSATAGNQPLDLHEGDYAETSGLSIASTGSGCGVADPITIRVDDASCYRSAKTPSSPVICDRIADDGATTTATGIAMALVRQSGTVVYCT